MNDEKCSSPSKQQDISIAGTVQQNITQNALANDVEFLDEATSEKYSSGDEKTQENTKC